PVELDRAVGGVYHPRDHVALDTLGLRADGIPRETTDPLGVEHEFAVHRRHELEVGLFADERLDDVAFERRADIVEADLDHLAMRADLTLRADDADLELSPGLDIVTGDDDGAPDELREDDDAPGLRGVVQSWIAHLCNGGTGEDWEQDSQCEQSTDNSGW